LKLNTTNIIAIIVIILFIGSMFVGVVYRPEKPNNIPENIDNNAPLEYYTAESEAVIINKFAKFIISSETTEYDTIVIEDNIKKIKGVKTINSNFNNIDENTIAYLGIITFENDYRDQIINNLQEIDFFTNIEIYEYALLEISQNIVFTSMSDENITIDYYLPTKKYEGIVSISSLEEDNITSNLQAIFKNEELYRLTIFEIQNISAQPIMISDSKTYPILSWNKEINIESITNFENDVNLENILDYNYTITKDHTKNLEYNISELENTYDLNSELQLIKDENNSIIMDYEIDLNKNILNINFAENLNLQEFKNLKNMFYENYNLDDRKIEKDLNKNIYFKILENDIDVNNIKEILNLENITINNITKPAIVEINDLNISNAIYTYDQNTTTVDLSYPKNKDLQEIELNISAYAIRTEIMFLMASEKKENELIEEN
jgi:hypothetical protein